MHLTNLEKILLFVLQETCAQNMIDDLYETIKSTVEKYIVLRDVENFIAFFKYALSTSNVAEKLTIRPEMVQTFIDRTYTGFTTSTHSYRAELLYEYLTNKLKDGTHISNKNLELLEKCLVQERKPSLEKIMAHARIATRLKWLQGPLKNKLSDGMRDYVIFCATIYGQYRTNRLFGVEWPTHSVSEQDINLIIGEYRLFEIALMQANQTIRDNIAKEPDPHDYREQFRVIFESLDNLVTLSKRKELDSIDLFKDKIIVSTALIYLQDEFVKKDPELERLIQLFVSLYIKFRDKRDMGNTKHKI